MVSTCRLFSFNYNLFFIITLIYIDRIIALNSLTESLHMMYEELFCSGSFDISCQSGFTKLRLIFFKTCEILREKLNTAVVSEHAKISPGIQ